VCPLVTKVHHEVRTRAGKGFKVVYVGHAGHDEAIGTMAVAPESVALVQSAEDVATLPDMDRPVALLAQTTLSHDEWSGVKDAVQQRWPDTWQPGRSDLCFATTNRQTALRAIAAKSDAVLVVGSANSSNTVALERVAQTLCSKVYRVNSPDEVPEGLSGVVGVTAGASAPEDLVDAVIARLEPRDGVEEVHVTEEDEYFPPPRELRELLRSRLGADALADDRNITASAVLDSLSH
jgi:4-hydroxy-3-methylbut-2-enyl diphosphate reductase